MEGENDGPVEVPEVDIEGGNTDGNNEGGQGKKAKYPVIDAYLDDDDLGDFQQELALNHLLMHAERNSIRLQDEESTGNMIEMLKLYLRNMDPKKMLSDQQSEDQLKQQQQKLLLLLLLKLFPINYTK